ncbi:MAG TPA: glycosyltransferase family 4 protein [Sedimentisphaerales bacterium]|nr:glycosyltransferase family 4 protein [Sedimentisphaerales bacterium]
MRIIQITPGTGNTFYCDNCLRDIALVRALHDEGHEVLLTPMYLPLQGGRDEPLTSAPIFFGGINVYLQQKLGFFRRTPRWIDWLFDRPGLLRWAGSRSDMTSAKELGEMTISMLRGEHGRQVKELERLVEWLGETEHRPDIVFLSNALLAGLAESIRERLGVPVVCLLQDEDGFLDGLGAYSERAWKLLRELAAEIDLFIPVSRYYSDVMCERLGLGEGQVRVVHTGIPLEGYDSIKVEREVPTIGFLSRMCANKGLDTLVEVFIRLKGNERLTNARLRIAGGKSHGDEGFIRRIRRRLEAAGVIDDVDFIHSFDRSTKLDFFGSLSVLSVPEKNPPAYSLYALEALAAAVPVVEPAIGVYRELSEITGGLVLYEPEDAEGLASALERVLVDKDYARQLGERGREAVFSTLDVKQTAREIVRICEEVIVRFKRGNDARTN